MKVETALDAGVAHAQVIHRIRDNIASVVHAPEEVLRVAVLTLVAEGHLILEDAPGVGKTLLAKALARSLDCRFARIQFTPDLLPSDITGVSVFDQKSGEFEFRPGPVFTELLLIDEVNRASPKTQAALLEAMQERQVTVDGQTRLLGSPFMVIATQNPIEYEGTYPLPEAQLDRFMTVLSLGYPPIDAEARLLDEQARYDPLATLEAVATGDEVRACIAAARAVHTDRTLNSYCVAILHATRDDPRVILGASPRAGIALMRLARANALARGRGHVVPDDVKSLAPRVLGHRLILTPEARSHGLRGVDIANDAVAHTALPL